MTLKEFLEKNPEAIKEAAKCKDVNEFKELTKSVGITFDSEEKLNKAFELVKNQSATELSDDALDAVSGGRIYEHKKGEWSGNPLDSKGLFYATSKGDKK